MGIDSFAIWKFKNVEGVLKYFMAYDFLVSKYQKGFITFYLHYDTAKEEVKFTSVLNEKFNNITCKFTELRKKLIELGVYELRDKDDCHSSATWGNDLFN